MRVAPSLVLVLTLAAAGARAQGFGLDLSEGPGLDLSGPDLRPTLAVVGAQLSGAPAPGRLDASLAEAVNRGGRFSTVTGAAGVKQALGGDDTAARGCFDEACARELAATLNVDLLVLPRADGASGPLKVALFLRDTQDFEELVLEGGLQKRDLTRAGADQLIGILNGVSAPRALLKLTVSVEDATVKLGERTLGQGSLEVPIPPIPENVRASAPEYLTAEESLNPVAGETLEVSLTLQRAPVRVEEPPPEIPIARKPAGSEVPIYEQPGFFLILGGVAATALGFGLGASAKSVEARAVDADGNGVLDITRVDALSAQRNATLANVLVAAGLVAAGGGTAWLVLAPAVAPAQRAGSSAGFQAGLVASGSF